jgi:hypothetical protein
MIVSLSCTKGAYGQLIASKLEFEIVDTTTSTLRIRPWGNEVTVLDEELRQLAAGLQE